MSSMSPRRPRLSGPFPALLVALLGMMVLLALGFAVWGLVIYPATATDTPLPIVGTLTAIAEVATSPLTETTPLPPTATVTSEAGDTASPTPEASPSATLGPTTAEPTATTPSPMDTATPTPTDTPLPPTPTPRPQMVNAFGYGIQAHALGNVNHEEIMATVKDLGFGWLKQQIEWKTVETAKGQYDWAEIDRLVDVAQQNGIYLLLSVVKAPDWARGPNPDTSVEGPPGNPQDFADFLGAMAARYKDRVQAYEIWNEQNLHYEWGNEQIDAARYVQLLAAAYQAIKAVDSRALVISGALTPAGSVPGEFALSQNYPNPFNASTVIRYQLASDEHVTLKVYNILGQEVRTLVDAPHEVGYYIVKWDGTDEKGQPVSSGVYIYSIKVGRFGDTKSMVLLK